MCEYEDVAKELFQKQQSRIVDENLQERFETCCKDCLFAKYEGNTQIGCVFDKIEKYRSLGVEILDCYDETKEFNVIKNRLCNTCRNQSWLLKNETLEQAIVRIKAETKLKADILIYVDESTDSLAELMDSIEAISNQDLLPAEVVVVNNSRGKLKSSLLMKILSNSNLNWSVESITDEDKSKNRALDIAINKSKRMMFTVINAGYKLPKEFLNTINIALNEKLYKFIMLLPLSEDNGLTILTKAFKYFGGNAGISIQEKLLDIAKDTNETHLIKNYSEL